MFLLERFIQLIVLFGSDPCCPSVDLGESQRELQGHFQLQFILSKPKTGEILTLVLFSEWKHLLCTENMPADHLLLAGLASRYLLFGV